jgi:hypothetical protein
MSFVRGNFGAFDPTTRAMRTTPERDPRHRAPCVYSITSENGRSYIGETSRPLAARLNEDKYNLKDVVLEKSQLPRHADEKDRGVSTNKASILEI